MDKDLNLKDTELRLGLPGTDAARGSKRASSDENPNLASAGANESRNTSVSATKAQVVGWPPIKSYRKNSFHQQGENEEMMYVKVSMDGAPYLRKIDIKGYKGYPDLLKALEGMFKLTLGDYSETEGYTGSDFVPTYEDKDGDWMLVGDVPWGNVYGFLQEAKNHEGIGSQRIGLRFVKNNSLVETKELCMNLFVAYEVIYWCSKNSTR